MPLKEKTRKSHHVAHKKEKRTHHFMKVYAPYIPLLLIIGCGIFISGNSEFKRFNGSVKSYATNTTDVGLLEATNKQRLAQGLQPLKLNPQLEEAAQVKAQDMGAKNYWSHVTPEGNQPWSFIDEANYSYRKAAENLAYGFTTSESTVTGWMNSPSHRENVLDPVLQEVGFGIINVPNYQDHGPETIVVAMYGQPAVVASASTAPLTVATATTPTQPQNISYIQSVTNGKASWSGFAVGIAIGAILMYLLIKHARVIRRTIRTSERFVVRHPLFDITLVALAVLGAMLSQTIGSIY